MRIVVLPVVSTVINLFTISTSDYPIEKIPVLLDYEVTPLAIRNS